MRRLKLLTLVSLCLLLTLATRCTAQLADGTAAGAGENAQATATAHPAPEDVLRQMTDYLGGLPAVSCRIAATMHVQMRGIDNLTVTKLSFRFERPRRFAMIVDEGLLGTTAVSDGKQLTQYVPAMKRYVVKDAPDDIAQLAGSRELAGMMMGGMGGFTLAVGGDAFYQHLMTGVTSSDYVGLEKLGDVMCHHCHFVQQQFDWDIWIEQGDRPLIHKIVPDVSTQLAQAGDAAQGAKMDMSFDYSDWNIAPKFTDADFAFTPPSGAEKVDSLFGDSREREEAPHPLLGQAAPPFKAMDLAKQEVDLGSELGKYVIILDFWATWCGPCCEALPIINEVADQYKGRGVVFHAVNLRDEVDTITEFLKSKKLDVPVVLDTDGTIGDLYKAEAIPQTVLIGKDGKVQVVHIGFSDGLAEELSKALDGLLEGKDLASATLAESKKAREKRATRDGSQKTVGATLAWEIAGDASGIAVDPHAGVVYAVGPRGGGICVDADGKTQREFKCDSGGNIRLANLVGDRAPEILTFQAWGQGVTAYSSTGETLWTYPGGDGVDDVWAADLDGDGLDEVVVGYNGGTGLHVLDHQGTVLWKFTEIGNVWHVTAGNFKNPGDQNVVTTSAEGKVCVFDTEGHKLKDVGVSCYANMVRMVPASEQESPSNAIVTGSGDNCEALAVVDFNGAEKWKISLPKADVSHVDDLAVASTAPWAAVAMRGGLVHVIDLDSHALVARVADQGKVPQVAWLPRADKTPLLVVASGHKLTAFEVAPTDAEAATKSNDDVAAADSTADKRVDDAAK